MKYKIGDKVKIREDLVIDENYSMEDESAEDTFVDEMDVFKGKEAIIKDIRDEEYLIDLDE